MKKLIIKDKTKKLVNIIIGVDIGFRNEPPGKRGITHLLEHVIFLGNESHPDPDSEVGKFGIYLNGMTLPEKTLFFFTSLKEDFSKIFEIFLDIIFNPSFDKEKILKEKGHSIITAIVNEEDYTPWELSFEWCQNLIFNWDFRYSLGTKEDLIKIDENVLKEWHKNYFTYDNSFVLINGDVDEKNLDNLINKYLKNKTGLRPSFVNYDFKEKEIFIQRNGVKNAETHFGFKIFNFELKFEILEVLFGNYPISILWDEKFKEHSYMVESKVIWSKTHGGFFIYFGANSLGDLEIIEEKFFDTIENYNLTDETLEIAKKIKMVEILKLKESGERGLIKFLNINPNFVFKDFDEIIENIKKIEKDEIINLVREIFKKENLYKVIVSDENL